MPFLHAKKVMSDSLGLAHFAVIYYLPDIMDTVLHLGASEVSLKMFLKKFKLQNHHKR